MADDEVMADAQIAKLLAQSNNLLQSNGLNGGMNEDNMELTAEDMEDPELLAQLAEIGGMDDDDAMNVDNDDNGNSDDDGMFEEMKATTLHSLQQVHYLHIDSLSFFRFKNPCTLSSVHCLPICSPSKSRRFRLSPPKRITSKQSKMEQTG